MTQAHVPAAHADKLSAILAAVLLAVVLLVPGAVRSEPYLAVRSGAKCVACHVNPTSGGKRTDFGGIYGQTALASTRIDLAARQIVPTTDAITTTSPWTGRFSEWFALRADLRATEQRTRVPGTTETIAFNQTRAQVYLEVKPFGDQFTLYIDERVAPARQETARPTPCSGSPIRVHTSRPAGCSCRSGCASRTTAPSSARSRV